MVSSGELWERKENEALRKAWHALVTGHGHDRSEAAVFARLGKLRVAYYHDNWPSRPLSIEDEA